MSVLTSAQIMRQVLLALIPGTAAMVYWFGWGILTNVLLAVVAAVATEAFVLLLRGRPVLETLNDCSAILAGWLLALTLPPLLPWWITVLGAIVALSLGKHLFGGLGYNPFNPAMVGYAVLLISYPVDMTAWIAPLSLMSESWDAITMATALDQLKSSLNQNLIISTDDLSQLKGLWAGKGWEWINLWFLIGGIWLLVQRTIDWRIPVAMLSVLGLLHSVDFLFTSSVMPPWFNLFSGATMLGAFFIATDPVSAATSSMGRWIYAGGIGLLVFVIRKWGGYPEGVAFAVLLMNVTAPTIDYYCRPRAFGE